MDFIFLHKFGTTLAAFKIDSIRIKLNLKLEVAICVLHFPDSLLIKYDRLRLQKVTLNSVQLRIMPADNIMIF